MAQPLPLHLIPKPALWWGLVLLGTALVCVAGWWTSQVWGGLELLEARQVDQGERLARVEGSIGIVHEKLDWLIGGRRLANELYSREGSP